MKLSEIIAKRLSRMMGRGGELEGVSAPVVAAVADLTVLELDEISPKRRWDPSGDYEICESCELVMKADDAKHQEDDVVLCKDCESECTKIEAAG